MEALTRIVGSNDSTDVCRSTEGDDVVKNIACPAKRQRLPCYGNDRNRGLRRDPIDSAPTLVVKNEITDDKDFGRLKCFNESGKVWHGTG